MLGFRRLHYSQGEEIPISAGCTIARVRKFLVSVGCTIARLREFPQVAL
jgi:hypothetical protein